MLLALRCKLNASETVPKLKGRGERERAPKRGRGDGEERKIFRALQLKTVDEEREKKLNYTKIQSCNEE